MLPLCRLYSISYIQVWECESTVTRISMPVSLELGEIFNRPQQQYNHHFLTSYSLPTIDSFTSQLFSKDHLETQLTFCSHTYHNKFNYNGSTYGRSR